MIDLLPGAVHLRGGAAAHPSPAGGGTPAETIVAGGEWHGAGDAGANGQSGIVPDGAHG